MMAQGSILHRKQDWLAYEVIRLMLPQRYTDQYARSTQGVIPSHAYASMIGMAKERIPW